MQRFSRRRHPWRHQSWRHVLASRIDDAAARLNPFLIVIAVGLVVLDLISLAALAPRLSVTRSSAAAAEHVTPPPRLGGLQ